MTQPADAVPADADATASDHLVAETDNSATPDAAWANQDPSVAIASDTDSPLEVTR